MALKMSNYKFTNPEAWKHRNMDGATLVHLPLVQDKEDDLGYIPISCISCLGPVDDDRVRYQARPSKRVITDKPSLTGNGTPPNHTQTLHVCHICLHWGGLGGQCRHIYI